MPCSSLARLVVPCKITQLQPYPEGLPEAEPRLSDLSHIWHLRGFPLGADAEQPLRTKSLVRGTMAWLVSCASHWEAARKGIFRRDIGSYFARDEIVRIVLGNRNPVKTITDITL